MVLIVLPRSQHFLIEFIGISALSPLVIVTEHGFQPHLYIRCIRDVQALPVTQPCIAMPAVKGFAL